MTKAMAKPKPTPETVRVNGEEHPLGTDNLIELMREIGIDPAARGLAVALNGGVVPRADWPRTAIRDGDAIEVVKLFAGG